MTPAPLEPTARTGLPLRAARVARPTVDLDRTRDFYQHIVGLPLVVSFRDHDGFDGVIFGLPDEDAQLEIVRSPHGEPPTPSAEDALVLYLDDPSSADELVSRLRHNGVTEIANDRTVNPYWARHGATVFADTDGYRLIVVPPSIEPHPNMTWRAVPAGPERDAYLSLFHLADDSIDAVRAYYQTGTLYAFDTATGDPLAIVLAIDEPDGVVELKAVAVDEAFHDRGIGTRLVGAVLDALRVRGARHVVVGTSSSGVGQLAFYQKAGFRLQRVERDYFTPERGYPPDLHDNGIPVRDTLTADGDDTILALRHTGLPSAFQAMHGEGWRHYLPLLVNAAAVSAD